MIQEYEVIGQLQPDVEIAIGGVQEIAQNIRTIITNWRGSVFLDRQFGINPAVIDQPSNMVLANLTMDITNQISKYEPRAVVTGITLDKSDIVNGEIIPIVTFRVKEGTLL